MMKGGLGRPANNRARLSCLLSSIMPRPWWLGLGRSSSSPDLRLPAGKVVRMQGGEMGAGSLTSGVYSFRRRVESPPSLGLI